MQSSKVKGCNQCYWYPVCSRLVYGLDVRHLVEQYQVGSSPRKTSEQRDPHHRETQHFRHLVEQYQVGSSPRKTSEHVTPIIGKHNILTIVHAPKTGAGCYGLCWTWRLYWFMCHWCKRSCLHQYKGTCSVPPRGQMYSLSVFVHDCREKNHLFKTKQ